MTERTPTVRLNTGAEIPQVGFGVFLVAPEDTQRTVETALEVGYRHIDTATGYSNEGQVGAAIRASGIDRDELTITTKLLNDDHRTGDVIGGFNRSIDLLGLEAIDLYLVHWPMPDNGRYVSTWETLVSIAESGRAHSVGVSNFQVEHLEEIIAATGVTPAVNQIELHPIFQQPKLQAFHRSHNIVTEAWGPLGQGKYELFGLPEIAGPAERHGATGAQVVLRWHVQLGNVVIPKSTSRARMAENLAVTGFELTDDEMAAIALLDEGRRISRHPSDVN